MKYVKHLSFKDFVGRLKKLPFGKTVSIAEDTEAEEGWWGITKINVADSKTLLCNYYGGGYVYAFSIDEQAEDETVEYSLKDFFGYAFDIKEDNGKFSEDMEVAVDFEEKPTSEEYKEYIFNAMIDFLANNMAYTNGITSKELANLTEFSLYRVRKTLKELESEGLIEKISEGIPPEYSYEGECIHEGFPPRNCWALTEKALDSHRKEWDKAVEKVEQSYAEWANGKE